MVLSPYVLKTEHLATQASVWRWSAKFQPRGQTSWRPAAEEFRTLEESFGMTRMEAEHLFEELEALVNGSHNERERHMASLRSSICHEQKRLSDARSSESRSRGGRSSGGGWSSGGRSFGGGCSSGGGAGCS